MGFLRSFLRIYSYIFETILCLGGLVVCVFASTSSNMAVNLPWLPWAPATQLRWVLGLSIAGLVCTALAIMGMARVLLFIFSGAVVLILLRGLFLNTTYTFPSPSAVRNALILVCGAALAFAGSYPFRGAKRARR